jgi:hypothetical protein
MHPAVITTSVNRARNIIYTSYWESNYVIFWESLGILIPSREFYMKGNRGQIFDPMFPSTRNKGMYYRALRDIYMNRFTLLSVRQSYHDIPLLVQISGTMKLAILFAVFASTAAFAPSSKVGKHN